MTASTDKRELAYRSNHGVSVSLFWDAVGDTLTLEVYDEGNEDYFELDVPRDRALDAFHHPYLYRARARRAHHIFAPAAA
jgi:hypothetical protein